jgi:hypothetical protein
VNGLNHHSDNFDVGVVDKILDVILDGRAELISARNNVVEPHLAVSRQRREDVVSDTAALRHERQRPSRKRQMELPAVGRNAVLEIEHTETIGTADRHSFRGEGHQPLHPGLAVATLPEAGRENNSRADAALERLFEDVACCLGRDREHDRVHRLRHITDGRKARAAEYFRIVRIDREQIAFKANLLEVFQNTRATGGALRGADHCDRRRVQKTTQIPHIRTAVETRRTSIREPKPGLSNTRPCKIQTGVAHPVPPLT